MSGPAFGILCCGRSVQTNYQTIDNSKIVFTIPDVNNVKFVSVFLTGSVQLPPGFGAAVYFLWVNEAGAMSNKYLGFVSNEKPSALFRLSRFHHPPTAAGQLAFNGLPKPASTSAQIGISMESFVAIKGYTPDPATTTEHMEFSQFCAENLYNYMASFAKPLSGLCPGMTSNEAVVPVQAVLQWYQKFSERLKLDPNFWKR